MAFSGSINPGLVAIVATPVEAISARIVAIARGISTIAIESLKTSKSTSTILRLGFS